MTTAIVLTVVSDDRPGIVEKLSELVEDHEGNWTESSMMNLAGKFAGIVLVHLPAERSQEFLDAINALGDSKMDVVARIADVTGEAEPMNDFSMELVGQDHPGIVNDITSVLAAYGINVRELETTVQSASMSGESLFLAHLHLQVPASADVHEMQDELEDLANELMVDIKLEP